MRGPGVLGRQLLVPGQGFADRFAGTLPIYRHHSLLEPGRVNAEAVQGFVQLGHVQSTGLEVSHQFIYRAQFALGVVHRCRRCARLGRCPALGLCLAGRALAQVAQHSSIQREFRHLRIGLLPGQSVQRTTLSLAPGLTFSQYILRFPDTDVRIRVGLRYGSDRALQVILIGDRRFERVALGVHRVHHLLGLLRVQFRFGGKTPGTSQCIPSQGRRRVQQRVIWVVGQIKRTVFALAPEDFAIKRGYSGRLISPVRRSQPHRPSTFCPCL